VPLLGPEGIFKPAILRDLPLSITTVPPRTDKPPPYDDRVRDDGTIRYRYRGTDPSHPDNVGLRMCMQQQVPLIYFFGIVPGVYAAAYPVFIVGDDPIGLSFDVMVDDRRQLHPAEDTIVHEEATAGRRRYITVTTQQRLHQSSFRERVLRAYRDCCAVCRLRHRELLDAAHIIADRDPLGDPRVSNGLALCKIHHAAFDRSIMGIRPDLVLEIRKDILDEEDGPMLTVGLQRLQGQSLLVLPRSPGLQPDANLLEMRYEEFRRAG
jgi:putative restriction endonuclease